MNKICYIIFPVMIFSGVISNLNASSNKEQPDVTYYGSRPISIRNITVANKIVWDRNPPITFKTEIPRIINMINDFNNLYDEDDIKNFIYPENNNDKQTRTDCNKIFRDDTLFLYAKAIFGRMVQDEKFKAGIKKDHYEMYHKLLKILLIVSHRFMKSYGDYMTSKNYISKENLRKTINDLGYDIYSEHNAKHNIEEYANMCQKMHDELVKDYYTSNIVI